ADPAQDRCSNARAVDRSGEELGHLTFHYPPYAVGPYAEGEYVAFVPWETLKPYLTPEGVGIFGGTRPKGYEDEGQGSPRLRHGLGRRAPIRRLHGQD